MIWTMTGKRRLLVCIMVILLALGLLISAYGLLFQTSPLDVYDSLGGTESMSGSTGFYEPGELSSDYDLPDFFIGELSNAQKANGSWEDDLTTTAISSYAIDYFSDYNVNDTDYRIIAAEGINWTTENYDYHNAPEAGAFIAISDVEADFQQIVMSDLIANQNENGSWNDDVSDTALATYALASASDPDNTTALRGIEWLESQKTDNEWDSVQNDAKAILALEITDNDIGNELDNLISKQQPDGSFGTVEDTAWALMAVSVDLDLDNLEIADKAILWLRAQNIQDEHDLALAALGEQYYNSAVIGSDILTRGLGPPFWLYPVLIIIIGSFFVSLLLFARLGSEDIMDGVRKDIYDYIAENPGEHLAEITRKFDISSSSARHHLTVLEWDDQIVSHKNGKLRHYYLNKNGYRRFTNGFEYKKVMSTLKNDTSRKIVKHLMVNDNSNQKSISEALNIHASTVNWHAKRLKDAMIITRTRSGKDILYSINKGLEIEKVVLLIEGNSS
jgi:predicted transcriptional regulator